MQPYDAGFVALLDNPPAPEDREQRRADLEFVIRSYSPGSVERRFWEGHLAALDALTD